ncbi:MAG: DNA alkylation repair protein [Anaerolineae bacterium]
MSQKAKPSFSLKDQLFNPEKVAYLANQFSAVYPAFRSAQFQQDVVSHFPNLELKARITHITECLHAHLPDDYLTALDIILKALPPELDPTKTDDDFGDFIIAPLNHFVAMYGCTAEYLDASLNAMKLITKRASAEDAIRFFINAFPEQTLEFLTQCATDENYHVRRWASEGTRPKLPWSQKLVIDHTQALPILDLVFADKTRYVTRSVANHLNDIAKIEPDLVISTLTRWKESGRQDPKEMKWMIQHATRTLIKHGNQDALHLLGFGEEPDITISDFVTSTPDVKIGDAFEFSLTLTPNKDQNLMIDYTMLFATDGKRAGQKVFKLKQVEAKAGKPIKIKKKHPMRLMTTRTLYLGEHTITLQVNGKSFNQLSFQLINP